MKDARTGNDLSNRLRNISEAIEHGGTLAATSLASLLYYIANMMAV